LSSLCATCDLRREECSDWGSNPDECGAYCPKEVPPDPRGELRIRLYQKNSAWYAECLDLDLLAKRLTRGEALRALADEIALYLETAAELGQYDSLVPRPAPASH